MGTCDGGGAGTARPARLRRGNNSGPADGYGRQCVGGYRRTRLNVKVNDWAVLPPSSAFKASTLPPSAAARSCLCGKRRTTQPMQGCKQGCALVRADASLEERRVKRAPSKEAGLTLTTTSSSSATGPDGAEPIRALFQACYFKLRSWVCREPAFRCSCIGGKTNGQQTRTGEAAGLGPRALNHKKACLFLTCFQFCIRIFVVLLAC